MIEQIAKTAHEVHRAYCNQVGIKTQPCWSEISIEHKNTIIDSAKKIIDGEITTLEESHNNFVANKKENGWKYGEVYSASEKINPRLLSFSELSLEYRILESLFFECVKSFID